MVLFKSNCFILCHHLSHYLVLKTPAKIAFENVYLQCNISREANIVDPDQSAPTGAVWSGFTLFIYDTSNSLVDDKNIHFVIMRFKG